MAQVNLTTVAERAGVSVSTASRALHRPSLLRPATRDRVLAVVERLGYVPDPLAQGLATGETRNVALVVPDISLPFFAAIARTANRAASERGMNLMLRDTDGDRQTELALARSMPRSVDGVIWARPVLSRSVVLALAARIRLVTVNHPLRGVASVSVDPAPGTVAALEHLAAAGHRHVLFVHDTTRSWADRRRLGAVRRFDSGVRIDVLERGAPPRQLGRLAAETVAASGATAVLTYDDVAVSMISAAGRLGLRVPDDVSVIGCDNDPYGSSLDPPLTTVDLQATFLGAEALRLAMGDGSPRTVRAGSSLVVRESVAPPPARRRGPIGARRRTGAR